MRYTLPGSPKLPPLKLINRITEKTPASEEGYFAFTALLEGARSKTFYRISLEEITIISGNAFGGGEILKSASYEEKIKSIALDITASTLFELRISGYLRLAEEVKKERNLVNSRN
jgi:hypothetical protein|tara:strand:+ start:355 stop:702 length:348 start_codon:yes stop_codon:yes gene_type:complete